MTPKEKDYENKASTIIKNLEKRQMKGFYCPTVKEGVEKVLSLIEENSSVAWGGSMSVVESGLLEKIKSGNYSVIDRDKACDEKSRKEIYSKIAVCDNFLMSTNAITLDGELVNIDGRGNRLSYLIFGPESVIILAGMNKVVTDVESAVKRIRSIATPANTVRLERKTPCASTGRCADCLSPQTICCSTVITRYSLVPDRIKVVLVGEELGY